MNNSKYIIQKFVKCQYKTDSKGQVMLLTILIFGGAMLSATIIASFLTTRSIRQSTLAAESAKAVFAADAGIDFLWYWCRELDSCVDPSGTFNTCDPGFGNLFYGPFANGSCYIATYTRSSDLSVFESMSALGYSNDISKLVARALYVVF